MLHVLLFGTSYVQYVCSHCSLSLPTRGVFATPLSTRLLQQMVQSLCENIPNKMHYPFHIEGNEVQGIVSVRWKPHVQNYYFLLFFMI